MAERDSVVLLEPGPSLFTPGASVLVEGGSDMEELKISGGIRMGKMGRIKYPEY